MKELLIKRLKDSGSFQKTQFRKSHVIELKESISNIVTEVDLACDRMISEWSTFSQKYGTSRRSG